jgi:hypothetical protein
MTAEEDRSIWDALLPAAIINGKHLADKLIERHSVNGRATLTDEQLAKVCATAFHKGIRYGVGPGRAEAMLAKLKALEAT